MILLSFLGFLLIAGVAFGIGMIGNVNRWLSDLPDYTDANAYLVSEPTEIVDCNGNKIASFYTQNRKSITKDQVSPYVLQGTIDVEDERFYEHGGIDLWGIARASVATLTGGHEGASTITQQLVRNTILQEEQFDSTIERKVREAYIAIKMEDMYSKDDILMMYLNTIYYGHGAYGIEAAAETYLSKTAADLTLSEAALLIGLPNSPSQYDPTVNPDLALSRRNKVLDNMLRLGHITQEEHDAAQAEPITLNVTEISGSGVDVYSQPYFVSYVKQLLEQEFSTDVLFKGGLTVKTTIDPTMQQVAEKMGMSTSTVSRAAQNKYIQFQGRTIPLRSFFTTAIRSDAAVSSHAVKQRIRSLIQAEDPAAPLSDEALRLALSALGVDVSRRVIAKYRAELNIPSSSQRKKR